MRPYSSFIFISHCCSCQISCLCQKAFGKRKCHENHCNYRSKPTPAGSAQPFQTLFVARTMCSYTYTSIFMHVCFFYFSLLSKGYRSLQIHNSLLPNSRWSQQCDVCSRLKPNLPCKCWVRGMGAFWSSAPWTPGWSAGRSYKGVLSRPMKLHWFVARTNAADKVKR